MKSIKDAQGVTYNNPSALDKFTVGVSNYFSQDTTSEQLGQGFEAQQKSGGGAMSSAMAAGAATGFNPYVMAGAAIIGAVRSKQEKKRQKKMGEARAQQEISKGESKKSDIYGQMATAIRGTLGSSSRQRTVDL